ncbi:hypothetical protein ACS0TY_030193 [Phlomoides rotata]
MVFICTGDDENIKVVKAILRNFEVISGLKTKYLKGKSTKLGRVTGVFSNNNPILLSWYKVGVNYKQHATWGNLIHKIKSRLARWKGKLISMGGKATLVQSVLFALPTYCLSFYKIPKITIREIKKVFVGWGFDEWDVRGRSRRVRKMGSSWWFDLCEIYSGSNGGGGMKEELVRIVGNGKSTYFWWDLWVGDRRLKDIYPRLFNCSLLKHEKRQEDGRSACSHGS